MNTNIIETILQLSKEEKLKLLNMIRLDQVFPISSDEELKNELIKKMGKDLRKCPRCKQSGCVKYGFSSNKQQKYKCKNCNKTYNSFTNTLLAATKLDINVWIDYAEEMQNDNSLVKVAEKVGVSQTTSFAMRHKILQSLNMSSDCEQLSDLVELDHLFIAESFKGCKTPAIMNRNAHKRGKQVKYRGLSREQVCIESGIDNSGNIIFAPIAYGMPTHKSVSNYLEKNISAAAVIFTDGEKSYKSFCKSHDLLHHVISSKHQNTKSIQINHINSLHSRLGAWLTPFKGVSTKHLTNYFEWFKFLEKNKFNDSLEKQRSLVIQSELKEFHFHIDEIHSKPYKIA
jgi:transposase-like protein